MLNQQPWMAHAASAIIADAADAVAIAASARFKAHWMFIRYGNNFIILPVHVSCVCVFQQIFKSDGCKILIALSYFI